jgi:hypothetical protein
MIAATTHRGTEALSKRNTFARCLGASVCLVLVCCLAPLTAQQLLLDRVLARVEGNAITLTDVRAAVGLGIATGNESEALQAVIDRYLVLSEVQRFPPPEPAAAAIDAEVAALKARAGAALPALMQSTGLDEARLRETARENLRIAAYLTQRFGTDVQVSDEEVDRYYRTHQAEFLRNGEIIPFAEAEPQARQRAAAERRQATIAQWISDLRGRAEITRLPAQP